MSHEAPAARTARRTGRPSRRRALAYVAGVGAVTTALVVQACADGGPTSTTAPPAPRADAATPGALETSKAGARLPFDPAFVGDLHNKGLGAVLVQARRASRKHLTSDRTRCALIARLSAEFAKAERTRNPRLAAVGTGGLSEEVLAGIAKQTACGFDQSARLTLGQAAVAATGGGEGRLGLSDDGNLSPAAVDLLNRVNDAIRWMSGASMLSSNLMPIQREAESLPDVAEQLLVRETIETARASAFFHENLCQTDPTACEGNDRPPDATRASQERRAGINSEVVNADAWGCIYGGVRGVLAGPPGILNGCFLGGIGSSGGRIFRYLILHT